MTWTVVVIKVVTPALLAIALLAFNSSGSSSGNTQHDDDDYHGHTSSDSCTLRCKDCDETLDAVSVDFFGNIIVGDGTSSESESDKIPTYVPLILFGKQPPCRWQLQQSRQAFCFRLDMLPRRLPRYLAGLGCSCIHVP